MSDQPEPLAAILAEMRTIASATELGIADNPSAFEQLEHYADRIEAATEREHAEWHAETEAAKEARNRVANRMRSEFAEKCRNCTERTPGNAAAMREALEYVKEMFYVHCNGEVHICANEVDKILNKIDAALSAPARNCDISRDIKETIERCLASLNVESDSASFDAGVCAAIGWMLAAPAEGGVK